MDTTSFSRFGIALAATSLVVGLVGFGVYLDDPEITIQPAIIHRHAPDTEMPGTHHARYGEARAALERFIDALADGDADGMRAQFPAMTSRDARVLNSIRRKLGQDAALSITSDRLTSAASNQVDIDFVLLGEAPNEGAARRLPFHATLRNDQGSWRIETLY